MYQKLSDDLYVVTNPNEFNQVCDLRNPKPVRPANYEADPVELMYPHRSNLFAEYPILVHFKGSFDFETFPLTQVIGSVGKLNILDFSADIAAYQKACRSKSLICAPRIMLKLVNITAHNPTRTVGTIVDKRGLGKKRTLKETNLQHLRSIRIVYGDGQFHGSAETSPHEIMFVTTARDVTELLVKVHHEPNQDRYLVEPAFNHYHFLQLIPELQGYTDTSIWKLDFVFDVVADLDTTKRYGQYWD